MKKTTCILVLIIFMLTMNAAGEVAQDLTFEAQIQIKNGGYSKRFVWDRNVDTGVKLDKTADPWILIETPENTPSAAVYIEFGSVILPFTVQFEENGKWTDVVSWQGDYAQVYLPYPPNNKVRLFFDTDHRYTPLDIRELFVYSEGETDASNVHAWAPQLKKSDLLVLVAHPDDELLWLGGILPYYAGEKQMNVTVAYLTCSKYTRRLELLNGLWHCGVHNYPEIGSFPDVKSYSTYDLYMKWGGITNVDLYVTRLLRRYKPEVVVTQALDGEYGHAAHMICPDTLARAVDLAADKSFDVQSIEQFGLWKDKKLYVHKAVDNIPSTVMNWRQPLSYFNGKTAFDIAEEAYRFHASQPQTPVNNGKAFFYVVPEDEENSSAIFTLYKSTVGEDEQGGDLFEHIDRLSGL